MIAEMAASRQMTDGDEALRKQELVKLEAL